MNYQVNIPDSPPITLRSDDGFTLAELIMVSFFTLFVLILLYQMVFFAQNAQRQTEKNLLLTNEVSVPLDIMDRYFSQNTKITTLTDYEAFFTVPTSDGLGSTMRFKSTSAGKIEMTRGRPYAELVLSKKNANVSAGTVLFKMLDKDSKPTTVINDARSVVITVATKGSPSGTPISSSRTVYFRNR